MTDSTPTPPAGWYPAPHDGGEMRYWDGSKWTEQTPPPITDEPTVTTTDPAPAPDVTAPPSPAPAKKRGIRWWGWTLIGVCAFVVMIIVIGSLNAPKTAVPAVAETKSSPSATAADEEPSHTPTPEAPPVPKVVHQEWSGKGDMVIPNLSITSPAIATFKCDPCAHNTVLKSNGAESLLVNTIGSYSGQHLINIQDNSATTQFTIEASGPWTLTVDDITTASVATGPASGHGDSVVLMRSDFTAAAITNNGEHNFVVEAYGSGGMPLIVNTIGAYAGTVEMAGPAFVQVTSTGDWSITPQ